jgi:hypothetical protein
VTAGSFPPVTDAAGLAEVSALVASITEMVMVEKS